MIVLAVDSGVEAVVVDADVKVVDAVLEPADVFLVEAGWTYYYPSVVDDYKSYWYSSWVGYTVGSYTWILLISYLVSVGAGTSY